MFQYPMAKHNANTFKSVVASDPGRLDYHALQVCNDNVNSLLIDNWLFNVGY
jgi:hypothetical protein